MKLSIIVPIFNEQDTLQVLVEKINHLEGKMSDIDIEIYSIDTDPNYCIENITTDQDTDCSSYENNVSCTASGCTWVISPTYNQSWDNFEMTIPAGTEGFPTNFYFEPGFYIETEEIYCSQINGEERCGTIVVTSINND